MAPLYEVVMLTKAGKGATVQLQTLLTNCAKSLWSRGAVLADIRPWGVRELAYRIRKQSQNHYNAQYVSMHVYCSPPTLHELEGQLRNSSHVLRHMTLRQKAVPTLDKATRSPFRQQQPTEALDLEADPTEAAKWQCVRRVRPTLAPVHAQAHARHRRREHCRRARCHRERCRHERCRRRPARGVRRHLRGACATPTRRYRNLVMQRVFEGRTKQELVAEQLSRHRFPPAAPPAALNDAMARRGPLVAKLSELRELELGELGEEGGVAADGDGGAGEGSDEGGGEGSGEGGPAGGDAPRGTA